MSWEIEYTDELGEWWKQQDEGIQDEILARVGMLEEKGPQLGTPYTSDVKGSRYGVMRELRIQYRGDPWRIFYAFDPRRIAILLIGGCKVGDERFYDRLIPQADRLYAEHLRDIYGEASNG